MKEEIISAISDNIDKVLSADNMNQLISYNIQTSIMWMLISTLILSVGSFVIYKLLKNAKGDSDTIFLTTLFGSIVMIIFLVVFIVSIDQYIQLTTAPSLWIDEYLVKLTCRTLSMLKF